MNNQINILLHLENTTQVNNLPYDLFADLICMCSFQNHLFICLWLSFRFQSMDCRLKLIIMLHIIFLYFFVFRIYSRDLLIFFGRGRQTFRTFLAELFPPPILLLI